MMEAFVLNGLTPREVSQLFDITESRLSILRSSHIWKIEEQAMRDEHLANHHHKLEALLPAAIQALGDVVVAGNRPTDRISAAREILDRGGLESVLTIDVSHALDAKGLYDTLEDIQRAKQELMTELGIPNKPIGE